MSKLVIGVDYGTDSCRALIIDTNSGEVLSQSVAFYPRWAKKMYCNPAKNQYRQHPQDYIDTLEQVIGEALSQLSESASKNIVALGIDTTGSTPCLTNKEGTPLSLLSQFKDDPDAMFILWKDHTAVCEADEINALAHSWKTDFTSRSGGTYSSEWFWAKALHVLRKNEKVREEAYSIIEHCDWMPALLTGNLKPENVKRSRCAAGHKGMWAEEWGGFPSQEFLSEDPLLHGFASRISNSTYTSDVSAGKLNEEWSKRLNLPKDIDVSVGIIDAHSGAIGAEIEANTMVKIIGTSTCDIIVAPKQDIGDKLISGISGQVDGSVIPNLIGLEAGQSAFGDIFAWLKEFLSWSLNVVPEKENYTEKILQKLTEEAEKLPITEEDLVANDWFNGRRTPFANATLKGGISGISLSTTPAQVYKSLVEAAAFGSRAIMEHLKESGVAVNEVIGVGGISLKSPFAMQVLSNVMEVPIKIAKTEQAGAMGAAMCAAVSSGIFDKLESAQKSMGQGFSKLYTPVKKHSEIYNVLYRRYKAYGNFLINNFN